MMAEGSKPSIISGDAFFERIVTSADPHNRSAVPFMYAILSAIESMAGSERTSLRWREKLLVPGNATVIFHTLNPRLPSRGLGNSQWTMTLSTESTWRSSSLGYIAWFLVFSFRNHIRGMKERGISCKFIEKHWLLPIYPTHRFPISNLFWIDLNNRDGFWISKILSEMIFISLLSSSIEIF